MHRYLLILAGILLIFQSCEDSQKNRLLEKRESELLSKEKLFAEKEAEYQALLKMRDSIFAVKDTVQVVNIWPETISGPWTGKVICTESNCTDYVVGDQRIDTWEFDSDSTQLVSKIINNNNLVRLYQAKFDNNEIKLNYITDSAAKKKVEMNVLLNEISPSKIRGTRTVMVDNTCLAKFSVELLRNTK